MRYTNKDITNLAEWCLINEIIKSPGINNRDLAKKFNVSKTHVQYVLKKLLLKQVIRKQRSDNPLEWREVLYYIIK